MSEYEEGIIREAGQACRMARAYGCAVEIQINRWWHHVAVTITPSSAAALVDNEKELLDEQRRADTQRITTG